MPANIEVNGNKAAFVAGRGEPGWHQLGTVVPGTMTYQEAMDLAHLSGWDVKKVPLKVDLGDGKPVALPGKYVTVRISPWTNEEEVLAVVGEDYEVLQLEDAFQWTEGVIGVGGKWDTAGALDDGRRAFGTMILDRDFVLDPKGIADAVVLYLGFATSFDGTLQTTAFVTPTRVVCQNTLTAALHGNKRIYQVRHTKNAQRYLDDAREALRVSHAYFGELEQEAKTLFETASNVVLFERTVEALWPIPEAQVDADGKVKNQTGITRRENFQEEIKNVYNAGTNDGIRDTAWGAFNAIIEFNDWYRQGRGDNKEETRLLKQLGMEVKTDKGDAEKSRVLSAVKEIHALA